MGKKQKKIEKKRTLGKSSINTSTDITGIYNESDVIHLADLLENSSKETNR